MTIDERFHPLVEGTSAAILVFDAERILYINPATKSLTGRSARDLLARSFLSLLHPQFRARYESPAALAAGGHEQVQIVRRNGQARWVDLWLQPILFRGSAATLATGFDIHDLKESDLARRDAEVQLKLVQRAGRTVSWDWRIADDELTVYGLPRNLLTHGAPTLTTTGKAFFDQVAPQDLTQLKQAIRQTLQDGEPLFLELETRGPQAEKLWVVLRGQSIADPTGNVSHMVGVATDVTKRRLAEEGLVREQEYTLAMLASITDGVIRTDLDGRIVDLSGPAEKLTGLALEEAHGRPLKELITFLDQNTGEILTDPIEQCLLSDLPLGPPQDCLVRRDDAEDSPVRFHTAVLRDQNSEALGVVLVLKDLNERKRIERGMVYLATHDPLTDLVNQSEFDRKLGFALAESQRMHRQDSLLYLDLDGFKLINDTFGHPAGDKMLKQFASFLKCRFRETDTLGRIGSDKFAVLLENCPPWQARDLVEKLYKDLRTFRFEWDETTLPVSLSTGLSGIGPDTVDAEKALLTAEAACYLAKQRGGDRYYEYEATEVEATERHSQLEILNQIQDSLREDLFELHAQLIQPLQAPETNPRMYEVLLRIKDRDGKIMLPGRFIPVAERHRIISAVDRWVLSHCLELFSGQSAPDETRYCINISGQSLGDERFLEFVLHELSYRGVEPRTVFFEITETATVANLERAQRFISVLRGRGCGFVLDDFGSGLSSFAYLRSFPVDFIKIDGQFVQGLCKDPTQKALVESINHVGHVMNIKTIAESVENEETLQAVRDMHVDYAQGFGVARPIPLTEVLSAHTSRASSS